MSNNDRRYIVTDVLRPAIYVLVVAVAITLIILATIIVFERDAYCDELKMQEQQMMMMESQND